MQPRRCNAIEIPWVGEELENFGPWLGQPKNFFQLVNLHDGWRCRPRQGSCLDVVAQHQLFRIRFEVKLSVQVFNLILFNVVAHHGDGCDQGNQVGPKIAD